jgi:CRISPR type III-A-associated protein Csm2
MKTAQARRFFNEVRRLQARLRAGTGFAAIRADILKLDSYAENAVKKRNAPRLFREFIRKNLDWATRDEKHFDAFVQHFECLIGYYPETRQ